MRLKYGRFWKHLSLITLPRGVRSTGMSDHVCSQPRSISQFNGKRLMFSPLGCAGTFAMGTPLSPTEVAHGAYEPSANFNDSLWQDARVFVLQPNVCPTI